MCLLACGMGAVSVQADKPVVEIEIRDHLFWPSEVRVPANTKVKLLVYNRDPTSEEFESYELNREKVIMGFNFNNRLVRLHRDSTHTASKQAHDLEN